jgi:hypothetical protein
MPAIHSNRIVRSGGNQTHKTQNPKIEVLVLVTSRGSGEVLPEPRGVTRTTLRFRGLLEFRQSICHLVHEALSILKLGHRFGGSRLLG